MLSPKTPEKKRDIETKFTPSPKPTPTFKKPSDDELLEFLGDATKKVKAFNLGDKFRNNIFNAQEMKDLKEIPRKVLDELLVKHEEEWRKWAKDTLSLLEQATSLAEKREEELKKAKLEAEARKAEVKKAMVQLEEALKNLSLALKEPLGVDETIKSE